MEKRLILDFEIESGTIPISLKEINHIFNLMPRGHPFRIYIGLMFEGGMRASEPLDLTWDNLIEKDRIVIYRPSKNDKLSKGYRPARRFRLSQNFFNELIDYRNSNFFGNRKIIPYSFMAVKERLKKYRKQLGEEWITRSGNTRCGAVAEFHRFTLRGIRTATLTLVFHYYSKEYGQTEMALHRTGVWACHSTCRITATHYIKRIQFLGLEDYPELPLLDLMDFVLYKRISTKITDFMPSGEQQRLLLEI